MYVPIQEPTQWYLDNLGHFMLISEHPWYTTSINYSLEGSVILPIDDEVYNNLYDYLHKISNEKIQMDCDYSDVGLHYMVMRINTQGQHNTHP